MIFQGIGNMTMTYSLLNRIYWQDIVVLSIAIVYAVIPMELITEWFFNLKEIDEEANYHDVELTFQHDYDRENPITK